MTAGNCCTGCTVVDVLVLSCAQAPVKIIFRFSFVGATNIGFVSYYRQSIWTGINSSWCNSLKFQRTVFIISFLLSFCPAILGFLSAFSFILSMQIGTTTETVIKRAPNPNPNLNKFRYKTPIH
jgi:hypothetical protein